MVLSPLYVKAVREQTKTWKCLTSAFILTFWGVKGAEVPLREVGDEYPPYRNLFILKKR